MLVRRGEKDPMATKRHQLAVPENCAPALALTSVWEPLEKSMAEQSAAVATIMDNMAAQVVTLEGLGTSQLSPI